jgi:dimethylhistidine N-methyltransferase
MSLTYLEKILMQSSTQTPTQTSTQASTVRLSEKLHHSGIADSETRLHIEDLLTADADAVTELDSGADAIEGLQQMPKSIPPRYFYDDRGSELFEQICQLPEYYPTRTEASILRHCAIEIARQTGSCELVELGSGSSTKTRLLLDAYTQLGYSLRYVPIDVSGSILTSTAHELLEKYPSLDICGVIATYELALSQLPPTQFPSRTICFLGSTLGNLNPDECDRFFSQIVSTLQSEEYFLLGVDLQKPTPILEAAYNDQQGVTAQFNLNMLRHLNHRFGGHFNLTQFEHFAIYNEKLCQIEMYLRSLRSQSVCLEKLNLTVELTEGETILTEISRKFNLTQIQDDLQVRGLKRLDVWTDPEQWFGVLLCQKL